MGGVAPGGPPRAARSHAQGLLDALAETARAGGRGPRGERADRGASSTSRATPTSSGLMLGREFVRYAELREADRTAIGADVGIAILDACASGAITRLKGGRRRARVPERRLGATCRATPSSPPAPRTRPPRSPSGSAARSSPTPCSPACAAPPTSRATARSLSSEAYQFAFHETLAQTDAHPGGRPAPGVRHQDGGYRRRGDDRRAAELAPA